MIRPGMGAVILSAAASPSSSSMIDAGTLQAIADAIEEEGDVVARRGKAGADAAPAEIGREPA